MDFRNKLVVITGVGRAGQLGEAVALAFAQRGAAVALIDRLQEEAEARARDLVNAGFTASAHAADITSAEQADDVARKIRDTHGKPAGVLINAAGGYGGTESLDKAPVADWQKMIAINLETAYCSTRAFLTQLREARGAIIYYTSVAALPSGNPKGMAAYAAAKSGVLSLMRSVAADEKANGIRANAIAPTAIRTAANIDSMGADKQYVDRESVADVTVFLAGNFARNVSGQVIMLA